MKAIELFAGAGGLGMGVSKAGFDHELIVEWNQDACDTVRENQEQGVKPVAEWPEVSQKDVRGVDFARYRGKLDLVAGGPPCQPFSLGGKHNGPTDSRDMFPEAVRAVLQAAPRAFIFENVRGLLRPSFGNYFGYIFLQLTYPEILKRNNEKWQEHHARLEEYHTRGKCSGLHYNVVFQVLNAADYGVPQKRDRVFVVGFRSDLGLEWSFPKPTHSQEALIYSKWVSGEYWKNHKIPKADRPKVPRGLKTTVARMEATLFKPSQKPWRTVRDAIADLPEPSKDGKFLNHYPTNSAKKYPGHTGSPLDEPAKTLKAGDHGVPGGENTLAYPNGRMRYFTVREAARLQTFPDNYQFTGSWTESMRQLGNAVPVTLGYVVAKSVKEKLDGLGKKVVPIGKTA